MKSGHLLTRLMMLDILSLSRLLLRWHNLVSLLLCEGRNLSGLSTWLKLLHSAWLKLLHSTLLKWLDRIRL